MTYRVVKFARVRRLGDLMVMYAQLVAARPKKLARENSRYDGMGVCNVFMDCEPHAAATSDPSAGESTRCMRAILNRPKMLT